MRGFNVRDVRGLGIVGDSEMKRIEKVSFHKHPMEPEQTLPARFVQAFDERPRRFLVVPCAEKAGTCVQSSL